MQPPHSPAPALNPPPHPPQELLELNLVPEEWGGSTPMCPVSAKKGTGVQDLLTQVRAGAVCVCVWGGGWRGRCVCVRVCGWVGAVCVYVRAGRVCVHVCVGLGAWDWGWA